MEADWSVALLAEDPVIAIPWTTPGASRCRFVDLRHGFALIDAIEEIREQPILRSALIQLNGEASQFWTSKCDAWTSGQSQAHEPLDPYEMDAEPGQTAFGVGSYIDMTPRDPNARSHFEIQERWLRAVVEKLRATPAKAARVELVLRPAMVDGISGLGVTWFLDGCGATAQSAAQQWGQALNAALPVILETPLEVGRGSDDDTMSETGE